MADENIWTGAVNFVLVSIPVAMMPAVREQRVAFRLMHEKDGAPLQRQMYCPADDTVVDTAHVVNGYPVDSDRYVVVVQEEYDALEPVRRQTIQIDSFVDIEDIDPVYFDRPYYLVPRPGGERSYRLLTEVLHQTRTAGLARFVLHDREHLVALWSRGQVLGLMMLHFQDQVRPRDPIRPTEARPQPAKVGALAATLQKLRATYDPAKYIDEHRQRLLGYLEAKARDRGTIHVAVPEETEEQPLVQEDGQDLVAALEESLMRAKSK